MDITTDKILQLGIIFNENEKTILINPGIEITNSYIHNITNEKIKNSPKFSDIALKLAELINKSKCLVGHNIKNFDWPIIYIELLRCGINIKKPQIIDTYQLIKEYEGSFKLKDIYMRYFNENILNHHNAIADIKATKRIYYEFLKKYSI